MKIEYIKCEKPKNTLDVSRLCPGTVFSYYDPIVNKRRVYITIPQTELTNQTKPVFAMSLTDNHLLSNNGFLDPYELTIHHNAKLVLNENVEMVNE